MGQQERSAATLFVLLLPSIVIASALFAPRFMAYLPGILGAAGACFLLWQKKPVTVWANGYTIGGIIIALAAASCLWAYQQDFAVERTGKMALTLLPGLLLPGVMVTLSHEYPRREVFLRWFGGALAAAAALICLEYFLDMPLYAYLHSDFRSPDGFFYVYNRASVILCLLFIGYAGMWIYSLKPKGKADVVLFAAACGAMLCLFAVSKSQTAQLAVLCGLLTLLLFPVRARAAWVLLAIALAGGIAGMPFIVLALQGFADSIQPGSLFFEASIPHRLEVWRFVTQEIFKHPLTGQGIEVTRHLTTESMQAFVKADSILHPHNAALQIWVEFGAVGAAIFSGMAVYMVRGIRRLPTQAARITLAMSIAFLSVLMTGYGLWQGWLIGTALVISAMGVAVMHYTREDR